MDGSQHITGVYSTTLAGEALPPLYIFESKAKEENYAIDPAILVGLPTVRGKYGGDIVRTHSSNVAMRPKGSMDISLWEMFRQVFNPGQAHYRGTRPRNLRT